MAHDITARPIGRVEVARDGDHKAIVVDPKFIEALDGIEDGNYLWVLYWMHELGAKERATLRCHPQGDVSRPKRGVFALHSPYRPNPIGMTRVRVIERRDNRLIVEGLDALDGSPVLDIKSG